jgi:hypothetical protein
MPANTRVWKYYVELYPETSEIYARIELYDRNEEQVGCVTFWRLEYYDKSAGSIRPEDRVRTNFDLEARHYRDVLDLLRNERPVYFDAGKGMLHTGLEPVGEGER